jgi:phosphate uptake regulator
MESRKLQLTGGSTIMVSLPKKWVDKAGLERGAEVVLVPQSNGTLLVDSRAGSQE